jgi:F0F1-type ATP synthase assembly protein I
LEVDAIPLGELVELALVDGELDGLVLGEILRLVLWILSCIAVIEAVDLLVIGLLGALLVVVDLVIVLVVVREGVHEFALEEPH